MSFQEKVPDELEATLRAVLPDHDQDVPASTGFAFEIPTTPARTGRRYTPLFVGGMVAAVVAGTFLLFTTLGPGEHDPSTPRNPNVAGQLAISPATSAMLSTLTSEASNATTAASSAGHVGVDGLLLFRGLSWKVPAEWVHSSYDLPCGEPTTDYAMIVTGEAGPLPACEIAGHPISGILIASNEIATTWMATAAATKQSTLNGLSVLTGADQRGNTIIVIQSHRVAFRIHAAPAVVRQILDSVRPHAG